MLTPYFPLTSNHDPPMPEAIEQSPVAPAVAARVDGIDKQILRRIHEANAAALRIDKRMEALKLVEGQLLRSVATLRAAIAAAQPASGKLEATLTLAQKQVDEALKIADSRVQTFVSQARQTLEALPPPPPPAAPIDPLTVRLQQHLSDYVQQHLPRQTTQVEIAAVAAELRSQILSGIERTLDDVRRQDQEEDALERARRIESQLHIRADDLLRTHRAAS